MYPYVSAHFVFLGLNCGGINFWGRGSKQKVALEVTNTFTHRKMFNFDCFFVPKYFILALKCFLLFSRASIGSSSKIVLFPSIC